jgi:hypothetical protein
MICCKKVFEGFGISNYQKPSSFIVCILCPRLFFLSKKSFFHESLPSLVEKIKQLYVLLASRECHSTITSFDLWMSIGGHDIFALAIKFLRAG